MRGQYIVFAIIIIILILITVSYYLFKKHQNRIEEYKQQMLMLFENDLIELFEEQDYQKYSGEAKNKYDELTERYTDLQTDNFVTIENLINDTDRLVREWRFSSADENEEEIESLLQSTNQSVENLKDDLQDFITVSDNNYAMYNDLTNRYYEARKDILANSFVFQPATGALEKELVDISDSIVLAEENHKNGDIITERQVLSDLSDRVSALEENIKKIPEYTETINEDYTLDLDHVEDMYGDMVEKNYVFEEDTITENIQKLRHIIATCDLDFQALDIDSVESKMDTIDKEIDRLLNMLETEYNAHRTFKKGSERLKEMISYLYKQNRQIKIETDRFGQMFHLDDSVLSYGAKKEGDIRHLQGKFEEVRHKSQANKLSYSKISDEVEKLITKSKKIYDEQNIYIDELYGLEDDVRHYKADTVDMSKELQNIQQGLQRSGLPGIPDSFKDLYRYGRSNLNNLIDELNRVRINFKNVDIYFTNVSDALNEINKRSEKMVEYAGLTEELLRILQQYETEDPQIKDDIDYIRYYYETINEYEQAYRMAYDLSNEIDPSIISDKPNPRA